MCGCEQRQYETSSTEGEKVNLTLEESVQDPLYGVNVAYIYTCELRDLKVEEITDSCISIDEHNTDILLCDGIEINPDTLGDANMDYVSVPGTYRGADYFVAVPCELQRVDTEYHIMEYDELVYYLENHINTNFSFLGYDIRKFKVEKNEFIYIKLQSEKKYWLIPVVKFTIKGYGEVYVEVNNGCIIWLEPI